VGWERNRRRGTKVTIKQKLRGMREKSEKMDSRNYMGRKKNL